MRISPPGSPVVNTLAAMLIAVCIYQTRSIQLSSASTPEAHARPVLLEKNEGGLRVRRMPADNSIPMSVPSSQFMLKVSSKNNGSQHLVLVTEELPAGARTRTHKHLAQDEIVLIQTGTAHVRLGDQERDVHAGGLLFIPTNTLIGLQNIGSEP